MTNSITGMAFLVVVWPLAFGVRVSTETALWVCRCIRFNSIDSELSYVRLVHLTCFCYLYGSLQGQFIFTQQSLLNYIIIHTINQSIFHQIFLKITKLTVSCLLLYLCHKLVKRVWSLQNTSSIGILCRWGSFSSGKSAQIWPQLSGTSSHHLQNLHLHPIS